MGTKKATESATAKKKSPKPAAPATIPLPEARAGQPYDAVLALVLTDIPYGRAKCTFDAMPEWLTFDSSRFEFSGVPSEAKSATYEMKLTITNMDTGVASKASPLTLDLTVTVGPQIAYANGQQPKNAVIPVKPAGHGTVVDIPPPARLIAAAPANAGPSETTAPQPSGGATAQPGGNGGAGEANAASSATGQLQLRVTTPQVEGQPSIGAELIGLPTGAVAPNLEIWDTAGTEKPYTEKPYQVQFKNPAGASPATVSWLSLDPTTQTYIGTLGSPLAAGHTYTLYLSSPAGQKLVLCTSSAHICADRVQAGVIQISNKIPKVHILVDGAPIAGKQTINGSVIPLPQPPVAAGSDATSAPGNLPLIVVRVKDNSKNWYFAPLQNSATTVQVGKDGRFSLTLQNALANGQTVQLEAIPPAGHIWDDPNSSNPRSHEAAVKLGVPLVRPSLATVLTDNVSDLSGTATASQSSASFYVGVQRIRSNDPLPPPCVSMNGDGSPSGGELEVLKASNATATTVQTTTNGTFNLTLATPLREGERFRLVQVLQADSYTKAYESDQCFSPAYLVPSQTGWGRLNADFTAGILVSNSNQLSSSDSGNFSQAHQFLDLTIEKAWRLPSCYLADTGGEKHGCPPGPDGIPNSRLRWPGVDSAFEARLTAIPVSTLTATQPQSGSGSGSAGSGSSNSVLSSNQLTEAQTARVGVQVYFPFLATRWVYRKQPNALFVAPLAKIGFDTLTGSSNVTVTPGTPGASTSGNTTTLTLEQLYNFRGYGARIGHYSMTYSTRRSPDTESFLDVTFGPYSNLESLHCGRTPAIATSGSNGTTTYSQLPGFPAPSSFTNSSCLADYSSYYNETVPASIVGSNGTVVYRPWETRQRLYRLDFEGLLKVPSTWFYVGFNANMGQKVIGANHLDHGYAAPDDLRFLFGTRFNIANLFQKLGITQF